jgi:peptidoglycan hydrolase-like protein with peptidoglycan-binding domain
MRGHDVRVLQDFLTRVGLATPVDGQYGPFTTRRVRSWERRSSRAVDGRMARPDARVLRGQVDRGVKVWTSPASQPADDTASAPATQSAPAGDNATIGPDGRAIAPASAPPEVQATIAAANRIVGKPYKYGGGHGVVEDSGYDCSGSVSYALRGGGLLTSPLDSSLLMTWGKPGAGTWITVYANPNHAYVVIAGLRLDTGGTGDRGPRWSAMSRPSTNFTARHPTGL